VAFKTGRLKEFVDIWKRNEGDLARDPTIALYRAAWMAVAGPPGDQAANRAVLDSGTQNPALSVTAHRLRSMVESMRLDVNGFQRSFEELRGLRMDTLDDHIRSWLTLESAGDHALAVAKATAYAIPPETSAQAKRLLLAWTKLRLENLAAGFARNQLGAFPYDPEVWFITSQMLVSAKQWDELRFVSLRMRQNTGLNRFFANYLDFLEGASENGNGRTERARELFATMLRRRTTNPILGLDASRTLERLGYRSEAQPILQSLEAVFGSQADYWQSLARLAIQSRDADALLTAAERAYRIEPGKIEYVNQYAAALLISRIRPAEAVQLTLQVLKESDYAHAAIINHSFALGRVGRVSEARKLLDDLPVSSLTDEEQTFWRMSMAEIELAGGNRDAAKVHLRGIDPQYLYSSQSAWLANTQKEVDAAKP